MDTNSTPMVSLVLITYNSAKFVMETLESIKAQTWQNIELIVSDDGSTDKTVEICSVWLMENIDRFTSVKILTVPQNTGIPSNCNRGFRASSGDWIKIISGDDMLIKTAIEDNIEFALQFPEASFIASDVILVDNDGVLISDKVDNEGLIYFSEIPTAEKQLKIYSRWPVFLNTPTFFCKREMLVKVDYCDEEFKIYEDMTMVIKTLENGCKLYYMKKPTVVYRVHTNATSRNPKIDAYREKEALMVFRKYRRRHLNMLNPLDLSVYYENWLRFKYKGGYGYKGESFLRKLSFNYWYMRYNGIKSY